MDEFANFRRRTQARYNIRHRRRKTPIVLSALLLVIVVAAGRFLVQGEAQDLPNFVRTASAARFTLCAVRHQPNCVIDGDTIHYGGTRIRIEDIDAPETHDPKCASELALGEQATRRLLELINAGPFEIVYTGGRDTDRYGRELRRIERDGRSLGVVLVSEGLARLWDGARHPWCR